MTVALANLGTPVSNRLGAVDIADAVVAAARNGDHGAFAAIVAHYDERLRVLAFQLLRDRDLMDDALQDVYANAYRALAAFRGESGLWTWLFRITYTTCMGYLRRRRKEGGGVLAPRPDEGDPLDRLPAPGADPADCVASRGDLSAALATLPAGQAAALILVYREGLTYEAAAAVLGIAPGTVGSRLTAARATLKRALGWEPNGEAS
jgi:RNA polymerase sigma-70 factor, ECF subfamily